MAVTHSITGPGRIVNRHAKRGRIEIAIDPSPDGFLTQARTEKARLKVVIIPGTGEIEPIEISVHPKALVFKFESAMIPSDRLADLEALITEEQDVHLVMSYTPTQKSLFTDPPTLDPRPSEPFAEDVPRATSDERPSAAPKERLDIKFKSLKGAKCTVTLSRVSEVDFRIGWVWEVGNWTDCRYIADSMFYRTHNLAIENAAAEIARQIEAAAITGTADQKRAAKRRLAMAKEQIVEQLEAWKISQV
jgi:hypothetical protein